MRRPARAKFSKRLMMIDLPIIGFVIGAFFSLGLNFSRANNSANGSEAAAFCQVSPRFPGALTALFSKADESCTVAVVPGRLVNSLPLSSESVAQGSVLFKAAESMDQLRYNVVDSPPFKTAAIRQRQPQLDQIVQGAIALLREQNYPTESVSISLVDLTGDCCEYGQFQDDQKRYPASVVKLFWLVALYGQYEAGILQPNVDLYEDDEALMAHYSNNGASSRVLDAVTQTESGESLGETDLTAWIEARTSINDYFELANYPDLNLAHKTFPIPDLGLVEREGRDLQLAVAQELTKNGSDGEAATIDRNYLTTFATARLLYEIETGQAISKGYSDRIKDHLKHSTNPDIWQFEESNAIEGFFGEYLPADVELYTKLGFTFDDGRQEAAIIASPEGKTRFVLVMFANDPIYSQEDSKVFPEVARYIYDQMQLRQTLP